ncbi:MAG: hypothetical protein JWQ71_1207 [Pedosphaera sp.]|nr:hypothetical protein [Pedosphaera sp.]
MKKIFIAVSLSIALPAAVFQSVAGVGTRTIPHPLPSHPGNIFVAGEVVIVPAPPAVGETWHTVDYDGKTVAEGKVQDGKIKLGQLPVGYYEVFRGGESNRVTVGVVEPLHAPTPLDSPIGIDVAMAWFFQNDDMRGIANICQLAGMNRVRDRLAWGEMEPKRGEIASTNRYDLALQAQGAAGLQVLQVNHLSAEWANPNGKHFPLDLRDIHHFYREMARRWQGQIEAFEPWNEADISMFGGHTGDEMASLQKAAYLGLKEGNPKLTVCQNVFAIHRQTTLRNFNENKAWGYFDTFNVHHYEPLEVYPKVYSDFREVSAGKPIWVSECNVTVEWTGDEQLKEPNRENLHVQSERVTKIYSQTIYEGAKAVFFFVLPQYVEYKAQYGLLHADMTPRPSFMAAAAAGRLLADAQRLGRVETADKSIQGFLFSAKPDGKPADVLVIWSEGEKEFELSKSPAACFDHLGRVRSTSGRMLKLTRAPLYVVLEKGTRPALVPPPKLAETLSDKPGTVIMQCLMPEKDIVLVKSAYQIAPNHTNAIPIFLYNFGTAKVHGKLDVTVPDKWSASFPQEVDIAPGERKGLTLDLVSVKEWSVAARIRIKGDFGSAGQSVLGLRFVPTAN